MKKIKSRKKKKNFPTEIVLNYLKETSKNLLDLSAKVLLNPDVLIRDAGFYVKYPSFVFYMDKWISNLENNFPNSSLKYKENKIYLTDKGRIKIIKSIVKEKKENLEWDGKYRAIVFDIPEVTRHERRFLRMELKHMGFKELQKSIWIYPYDVEKELFALLKLWKKDFRGDIRFLKVEKIIDDEDIKKYYGLSDRTKCKYK